MTQEERTLILFKPDCVRRNLSGEILQRLLGEGFVLRGIKMMQLDEKILREHYAHIIDLVIDGEPLFPKLSAFMQSSPVIAIILEGPGVVTCVRNILGPTNSQKAPTGTIRRKTPSLRSTDSSARKSSSDSLSESPDGLPQREIPSCSGRAVRGRSVRISPPWAPTATVCSKCAAHDPSAVTAVHSSGRTFTRYVPKVIIGSIARIIPRFR